MLRRLSGIVSGLSPFTLDPSPVTRLLRRFSAGISRLLLIPVRLLSRLTLHGGLFLALAFTCGLASTISAQWANIPLFLSLVLVAVWLLAAVLGARALQGIHLKRTHSDHVFAHEPLTVVLHVTNMARLPMAGLVLTDHLEAEGAAAGAEAPLRLATGRPATTVGRAFVTLACGGGMERARYSVVMRRRGIYGFGSTALDSDFPLGFFHSGAVRHLPGRLAVYPRMGEVDVSFLEELELTMQARRSARPSRAEHDYRGLREYRFGDSAKWIHWRRSARLQKLLVKEFEEPQTRRVVVLLDTNLQRLGPRRLSAFELAISCCASLARELARRGCEVECVALQPPGRVVRVIVSRQRHNLDVLLEALAGLRRDDSRTLADLCADYPRRHLHNVCVLGLLLGSGALKADLNWLHVTDNAVRLIDVRGPEFRQFFRPGQTAGQRDDFNPDDVILEGANADAELEPEGLRIADC